MSKKKEITLSQFLDSLSCSGIDLAKAALDTDAVFMEFNPLANLNNICIRLPNGDDTTFGNMYKIYKDYYNGNLIDTEKPTCLGISVRQTSKKDNTVAMEISKNANLRKFAIQFPNGKITTLYEVYKIYSKFKECGGSYHEQGDDHNGTLLWHDMFEINLKDVENPNGVIFKHYSGDKISFTEFLKECCQTKSCKLDSFMNKDAALNSTLEEENKKLRIRLDRSKKILNSIYGSQMYIFDSIINDNETKNDIIDAFMNSALYKQINMNALYQGLADSVPKPEKKETKVNEEV